MRQVMLLAVVLSIVLQSRPVIDAQSQPSCSTESVKEEVVVATRTCCSIPGSLTRRVT